MKPQAAFDVNGVSIPEPSRKAMASARDRQSHLTKPPGSLGRLEDLAVRVAGIRDQAVPEPGGLKRVLLFAGDHGVTAEGVSAYPSAVTPMMVRNFLAGGAAINALAGAAGAEVRVVDVGVAADLSGLKGLVQAKVGPGTRNLRREPAMTEAECAQALEAGWNQALQAQRDGVRWIALGEMGIGNTTAAAALMASLLPCPAAQATGLGTGISPAVWRAKCAVIRGALKLHRLSPKRPLEALRKVGGFEIAALTGAILGAAARRIPVVVDGYIASAAYLAAFRFRPGVKAFCFFAHRSQERGHQVFFRKLGLEPILDLGLRLGEGTGAAMALPVLEAAVRAHSQMATFEGAAVPGKTKEAGKA